MKKFAKSDKIVIAVLQAIAVFMFVLVAVRFAGCTKEVSNVTVPEVMENTKAYKPAGDSIEIDPIIVVPAREDLAPDVKEAPSENNTPSIYEYDDTEEDLEDIVGC